MLQIDRLIFWWLGILQVFLALVQSRSEVQMPEPFGSLFSRRDCMRSEQVDYCIDDIAKNIGQNKEVKEGGNFVFNFETFSLTSV